MIPDLENPLFGILDWEPSDFEPIPPGNLPFQEDHLARLLQLMENPPTQRPDPREWALDYLHYRWRWFDDDPEKLYMARMAYQWLWGDEVIQIIEGNVEVTYLTRLED